MIFYCETLETIVSTCITLVEGGGLLGVGSIPSGIVSTLVVKELDNPRSMMLVLSKDGMSLKLHLTIVLLIGHQFFIEDINANEFKLDAMK
jgi:hypothetical protein